MTSKTSKSTNQPTNSPNWRIPLIILLIVAIAGLSLLLKVTTRPTFSQTSFLASFSKTFPHFLDNLSASLAKLEKTSPNSPPQSTPTLSTGWQTSPTTTDSPALSKTPTLNPKRQNTSPPTRPPTSYLPPNNPTSTLPQSDSNNPWLDIAPGELGSPEWQAEFEKRYQEIKREIDANRQSVEEKNQEFSDQLTSNPAPPSPIDL